MDFLIDLIPARARRALYAVLTGALAVWGIWQATEGDWLQFAIAVVTGLVTSLATANTVPVARTPDGPVAKHVV